jgi:HEPN domain-containing protein
MKPITREWINKAEGDWAATNLLFRARRNFNYDATCFHAQQCAEKYLKARLEDAGVRAGKTHDLVKLLSLILSVEPSWKVLREDLILLTDFAVDYRYPGSSATKADAKAAVQRCRKVRLVIRRSFGLKV